MAKLTLSDVSNLLGNPTTAATTINANSDLIEAALENTLSRDGTTPNQMAADLDMNNNDVLNVATIAATDFTIAGSPVTAAIQQAVDAAIAAEAARDDAVAAAAAFRVATRTELKALDTASARTAYLTESPREGMFIWETGDYSAQITADTLEGIYIKADAIASTTGAWVRVYDEVRPRFYGADGVGDDTAAVQAAFDFVQSTGDKFDGTGPEWPVTKITIANGNTHFEIAGVTKFKAIDTVAQTCLVEGTRGNFTITGSVSANCQYKTNYAAAFWFHNDTQIQFAVLNRLIAVAALIGIRIGDVDHGASVTSEITVTEPRTYGCPIAMQVEGGNTYITISAPPGLSADAFGGDVAWQALTKHALVVKGAAVNVVGGELIQTASGLATDYLIGMQPGMLNTDISWGKVTLLGVVCESAGPLLSITNPDVLSGTDLNGDKDLFSVIGCLGFHSQDNAPFISAVADYPGDIRVANCDFWYPGGTRTQPNISCAGTLCNVYVDEHGFGNGFRGPISGTVGGIVHFSKRIIYQAYGLPSSNLVAGIQTLLWQSFVSSDDHIRFQGYYSTATGQFTVPAGGLRNIKIRAQAYATGVTGYMVIRDGGTEVARASFANDVGSVIFEKIDIAAGTLIEVALYVTGGAGVPPNASQFLHTFTIEAMN